MLFLVMIALLVVPLTACCLVSSVDSVTSIEMTSHVVMSNSGVDNLLTLFNINWNFVTSGISRTTTVNNASSTYATTSTATLPLLLLLLSLLLYVNVLLKMSIFHFYNDPRPCCVDVGVLRKIL